MAAAVGRDQRSGCAEGGMNVMSFERWFYIVRLRLRSLFRRAQVERELDEELQFHSGLTAHAIARSKEKCRDVRGINIIDDFVRDLALAIRILRKSPVFA